MIKAKAKDVNDWKVWHYGILETNTVLRVGENSVSVVPRTVCEDTGYTCSGRTVYENDWLDVFGDGEHHKFLVVYGENGYRAAEDEEISYDLKSVLSCESCKIVGNLYD